MSRDTSGGGLWPEDEGGITILSNTISLRTQSDDDVPDEGCSCPTIPDDDEDVFLWIHLGSYMHLYH